MWDLIVSVPDHCLSFYFKYMLVTAPILAHPDFNKSFIFDTDANNHAVGAVLSQKVGDK